MARLENAFSNGFNDRTPVGGTPIVGTVAVL